MIVEVVSSDGDVGVVAIDDFSHSSDENCETLPAQADPKTTTVPVPTTPEPTEPPGRKIHIPS